MIEKANHDHQINTQTVKKSKAKIMGQAKLTQAQVHISVHSYADTSFLFNFKNTRCSKHFVARFRLRRLRRLFQRILERQALRWNPLPMVPGAGRSVLVPARKVNHCQSQRQSSSTCIDQVLSQLLLPFLWRRHLVSSVLGEQLEALQRWWLTFRFSCRCIQLT